MLLSGYIGLTSKQFISKSGKFPVKLLLLIGVFDMAGFLSYSYGVAGAYASIVAPIGSAFALVSILLAKIFLKEKISLNQMIGMAAIVSGVVLIAI
jgi:drug/metabolite transporter (DMT)-like permease